MTKKLLIMSQQRRVSTASAEVIINEQSGMPEGRVDTKNWLKHKNLRKLNFLLLVPLMSIFTQG